MVSQAALCTLQDRTHLPRTGGVLTPAVAFGFELHFGCLCFPNVLIQTFSRRTHLEKRLANAGLAIESDVELPQSAADFFPPDKF